jgi:hypothetical protein
MKTEDQATAIFRRDAFKLVGALLTGTTIPNPDFPYSLHKPMLLTYNGDV